MLQSEKITTLTFQSSEFVPYHVWIKQRVKDTDRTESQNSWGWKEPLEVQPTKCILVKHPEGKFELWATAYILQKAEDIL